MLALNSCVADDPGTESVGAEGGSAERRIEANAVAIAANPDGGFYWAALSGVVHSDGGEVIATINVDSEGQRGLVGLSVDSAGAVFVGYVAADLRLTVAELLPDNEQRIVWRGPETVQGGNGGRILFDETGRLIIGVGLLNDRQAQADPANVTGKLLALDPAADPDQSPEILSGPWNNPFAMALTSTGEIWVADNDPRDGDERLALGDNGIDPAVAAVLPPDSAPAGMTAVQINADSEELWICTYNTRQLLRYTRSGNGFRANGEAAADCLLDVTTLADGRVVYSTGEQIVILDPADQGR